MGRRREEFSVPVLGGDSCGFGIGFLGLLFCHLYFVDMILNDNLRLFSMSMSGKTSYYSVECLDEELGLL